MLVGNAPAIRDRITVYVVQHVSPADLGEGMAGRPAVVADDELLARMADVDGNVETRSGTISLFQGTAPTVLVFESEAAEESAIADWLRARLADGVRPEECAVFVRSEAELP